RSVSTFFTRTPPGRRTATMPHQPQGSTHMAKSPKKGPVGRRQFIKAAAAGTAGLIASPQVAASPAPQAAPPGQEPDHDHQDVPADVALRVKALESLLVEKGLVDSAALDAIVDIYEHKVGP